MLSTSGGCHGIVNQCCGIFFWGGKEVVWDPGTGNRENPRLETGNLRFETREGLSNRGGGGSGTCLLLTTYCQLGVGGRCGFTHNVAHQ